MVKAVGRMPCRSLMIVPFPILRNIMPPWLVPCI